MPGTGAARKVRLAGRSKGKSGGFRIITFFGGIDIPVFLISVYAKADKVNLTQQERNTIKALVPALVDSYMKGVRSP